MWSGEERIYMKGRVKDPLDGAAHLYLRCWGNKARSRKPKTEN